MYRKFYKSWNAKLDAKRSAEFEEEKVSRDKAREELGNWTTQRGIRLNAKKECLPIVNHP